MKKLLILPALLITMMICSLESKAQKVYDFVSVDKVPEFPGGMKDFYDYLGKNIKFPAKAKKDNVQGKVWLSFVVENSGKLTDITVTRGLTKETDAEAVRVFQQSPKWNAGIVKGKPVRVKYNMNVNFKQS
ncbi:energy transducer TonB [Pedobacter jejuensis]|uniref:Energy transducer TonB n=1 Tax=Pedobacter jejuensis TaxID=1268550 RepID=A0A3N0BNG6_9SPHI|nr:energy transducer TonB [Pedobacter jejuensis]RNL50274.1 energy transducer TonB [Pedobacter jejuensis]